MSISPARSAAFDILLRIEQQEAYASELLHSSPYAKLSTGDHGLATELTMGVLRWRSLLDANIRKFSSKGVEKIDVEVLTALRLAAYQLLFLDRIPSRAAVHESVELVKRARKASAAPFANAVLRKLAGSTSAAALPGKPANAPEGESTADLSRRLAHPLWLVERWVRQFGLERVKQLCNYNQQPPVTAVRLTAGAEAELKAEGIDLAPGQLLTSARRVLAGNVSRTRAFAAGRVRDPG